MLVLATGFDAISGSMLRLKQKGRGGLRLQEKWKERFRNYLGMTISDFPNLLMIHGPGTPGVLYVMPLGAELETAWLADCIAHMREQELGAVETKPESEESWDTEVAKFANATLHPRTDSWNTGANIEGKPRQFCVHVGGPAYFKTIGEVAAHGFTELMFDREIGGSSQARLRGFPRTRGLREHEPREPE